MIPSQNTVGTVKSIFISSSAGEPMQKVNSVRALKGQGLEGDRYAKQMGFWQKVTKPRDIIKHVSIIRAQDIQNSGFTEAETRRNIVVTTDINLIDLIGKEFYIGEVLFRGVEDCAPCKRPSELSGKPDFAIVFKNRGGLRAEVLSSGVISEGIQIQQT